MTFAVRCEVEVRGLVVVVVDAMSAEAAEQEIKKNRRHVGTLEIEDTDWLLDAGDWTSHTAG